MLCRLSIRNYALIDHIEWTVDGGWTVLTGETGSGKSILLGALGLVLGARAEAVEVRGGKCIVEAEFKLTPGARQRLGTLDEGGPCILRRSITTSGRSRAYVNDEPVKLQFLKSLAPLLVDLHGQQDGQRLQSAAGLLHAVDALSTEAQEAAATWREAQARWAEAVRERDALEAAGHLPDADADYLRYQLEELGHIDFEDEGLSNIDQRLDALSHAREIKEALQHVHAVLQNEAGALDRLHDAERALEGVASVHPGAAALLERVRSCRIELDDAAREAEQEGDSVDLDPAALARAEADRDRLQRLFDKHRADSLDALHERMTEMQEQLSSAENRDRKLAEWNARIDALRIELDAAGDRVSQHRSTSAEALCAALQEHLAHLKMPAARLHFEWSPTPSPEAAGPCRPTLLFTANAGLAPQPMTKVASGGERSRVMLALKAALSEHLEVPTLILDEIDAGVSGDVAARMADLMAGIARRAQVITISHLPQVAGRADHHFKVSKTEEDGLTTTQLQSLDAEGRVEELAAMLSGSEIGDAARAQARSLMG
ncbi:MAG: DNA repair protein RecN [Crocinitomicaceae bacterium TMED114]|nr:MAG: DNA repair protein RecN [Crocinitomicaceae bacterium TMED114]